MDRPEDMLYLKQFVKQHPENKMGWYLLGKQYLQAGKEGKANYCFIQAGDVYDAFEQESHPLVEEQLELLKEWDKNQKKKRLYRKIMMAAIPLLAVALFIPINMYVGNRSEPERIPEPVRDETLSVGVVYVPKQELRPIGNAMNQIAAAGAQAPKTVIAAKLEEEAGWLQWTGQARFLLSVERKSIGEKLDVTMFNRDVCACEPADTVNIGKQYKEWSERQEMHWTLASGIQHYERMYGNWPEKLDDLIRPYPYNVLAGEGDGMREMFGHVLEKVKAGKTGSHASNQDNKTAASEKERLIGTNGLLDLQWNKPLEIIVDTSNYQLAVVQHNMIIRSYTVGLGGERTPEGRFYISEKVRNPNGTDKGIFGSRGMTLSNTLYAIHGTDHPDSIGKDESLGCIRMSKADVEELYDLVPLGTAVQIKNGTLPSSAKPPAKRFQLEPKQDETNPVKIYQWLT